MDEVIEKTDNEIIRYSVHELRNIFCVVVGNLELLRMRSDPAAIKLIDRAMHGAQRADEVIALLSGLSRAQTQRATESVLTI